MRVVPTSIAACFENHEHVDGFPPPRIELPRGQDASAESVALYFYTAREPRREAAPGPIRRLSSTPPPTHLSRSRADRARHAELRKDGIDAAATIVAFTRSHPVQTEMSRTTLSRIPWPCVVAGAQPASWRHRQGGAYRQRRAIMPRMNTDLTLQRKRLHRLRGRACEGVRTTRARQCAVVDARKAAGWVPCAA